MVTIPKAKVCAACGADESKEKGWLFLWSQVDAHNEWWHVDCIPPVIRADLESRGWEFPPGPIGPT